MEKIKILIVEDEAIIAMEIEISLKSLGYQVTSIVDTGDKAIEKAEEDKPDIILMDIRIKGEMDGIEAADIIRSRFEIPIIFLTAYLDENRLERAKLTMPFGYILKPVQERDLRITIEMALYISQVDAERKKAEEKTIQFGQILEGSLNEIFIFDSQTLKFNQVNNGARNNLQYSIEELRELTPLDIKPEYTAESFKKLVEPLLRGKEKIVKFNTVHRRKDNSLYPVEVNLQLISYEGSSMFVAIIDDITERKHAEEEILRSKILLESSIESPKDMIILSLDREYRYVYFNKIHAESMAQVYGTQPRIGDCIFDYMQGKEDIEKVKSHYDRAMAGEGHVAIEKYGEDQLRYYYEIQYNPVYDDKKEIIGVTAFAQNITERKQAETVLHESEERYRNLVELSHDLIFSCDTDGHFTYLNQAWSSLLGYHTDEMLGHQFSEFKPPEVDERDKKTFQNILVGQDSFKYETIYKTKTGELKNLVFNARLLKDSAGTVIGTQGTAHDITDRKKVEKVLRESEGQLQSLVKNIQAAVVVHDSDTKIVASNTKAQELLGLTEDQMLGKTSIDPYWKFLGDDRTALPLDKFPVNKVLTSQQPLIDFIVGIQRPDKKELVWVLVNAVPVIKNREEISQVIITFTDITELKETEEALKESEDRLMSFYDATFEGIAISEKGKIIDFNNQFTKIIGYERDELIGMDVINLLAKEDRELVITHIQSDFDKPYDHKAVRKDGSIISIRVQGQKIRYHGRAARVTAIQDITERKKAEEDKNRLIIELQDALEEVRQLSGLIPICANCKKIRDDKGYWNQIEVYIEKHSDAQFSHGICQECAEKLYGDSKWFKRKSAN